MPLIALGINHRTAPVELREKIAITGDRVADALRDLASLPAVNEAAILSTCNRTELYCGLAENQPAALTSWLSRFNKLDPGLIKPHLYSHPDELAAARRRMRAVVEASRTLDFDDARANLIEPQLGYALRDLERSLQVGEGHAHGLVGIYEIRKE
jgi:hypothetical protein